MKLHIFSVVEDYYLYFVAYLVYIWVILIVVKDDFLKFDLNLCDTTQIFFPILLFFYKINDILILFIIRLQCLFGALVK